MYFFFTMTLGSLVTFRAHVHARAQDKQVLSTDHRAQPGNVTKERPYSGAVSSQVSPETRSGMPERPLGPNFTPSTWCNWIVLMSKPRREAAM